MCEGQNIFDYYYSTSLLFLQDHLIFVTRNRILDPQRQTGFSVEPNFLVEMFDFSCMTPSSTRGRLNVCLELSLDPTRSPFRHWGVIPATLSPFGPILSLEWYLEAPHGERCLTCGHLLSGLRSLLDIWDVHQWVVKNQMSISKPNKLLTRYRDPLDRLLT